MDFAQELERGRCVTVDLAHGGGPVRGFVHAVDSAAGLLCLEEVESAALVLVSLAAVVRAKPLAAPQPRAWPEKGAPRDAHAARAAEKRVLRDCHEEYLAIGVGVSPEAQDVFDALRKNFPCQWRNEAIVIFDSVQLLPPYTVAEISKDGDADVRGRVRTILEGRRAKHAAGAKAGATNGLQK